MVERKHRARALVKPPLRTGRRFRGHPLLSASDTAQVLGNTITAHKRGFVMKHCANAMVDGNVTDGNGREGTFISHSDGLAISNNTSDNNGTYGFRIDHSPPIATIADLTGAGNVASGNGTADFSVD